jgi:L-ribulose-5-phosphate 3-epimerase
MILGYVSNGFSHHRLEDAIDVLAGIGYRSIAVTLDYHHLDPFDEDWPARATRIRRILDDRNMRCTVETGARYLLDSVRKHQPTLVSREQGDRDRRVAFLCRAVDVAEVLGAESVSLWSGATVGDATHASTFDVLCDSIRDVLAHAERSAVPLSFEPEPGMYVDRMDSFERLFEAIGHPLFRLTLDVGHVHCLGDGDLATHIRRWRDVLVNVHIEDMRRGTHDHLMFGEGEMNFSEIASILTAVDYRGPVHVELPRHSHDAPSVAMSAFEFLSAIFPDSVAERSR